MTFDDLHYHDAPEELFAIFVLFTLEETFRQSNANVIVHLIKHFLQKNFYPGDFLTEYDFDEFRAELKAHDLHICYGYFLMSEEPQSYRIGQIVAGFELDFSVYLSIGDLEKLFQKAVEKFTELQIFKISYLLLHRASENAASVQRTHDRLQDHLFDTL